MAIIMEEGEKYIMNIVVLGASPNKNRYSYLALQKLKANGYTP